MRRTTISLAIGGLALLLPSPDCALAAAEGSVATPPPVLAVPEIDVDLSLRAPGAPESAPAPTFEEQVVERVNVERLNCSVSGCPKPPLKHQPNLIAAAEEHSQSMAVNDYFSHRDFAVGCNTVGTRMTNAGYSGWTSGGENIAGGQSTPTAVMNAWMGSSGHRANILGDCEAVFGSPCPYREIGVGYVNQGGDAATVDVDCNTNCTCSDPTGCGGNPETCSGGPYFHYWTQVFGARGGTTGYPVVIEREAFATATPIVDLYLYPPPGTGAQMRFANETGDFTAPETFNSNVLNWNLTAGDGRKAVIALVTTSSGTFRTCDRIWLDGSGDTSFVFAEGFECDGFAAWSDVVGGS